MVSAAGHIPRYCILGWCRRSRSNLSVMRSCILVRWRLSRACTLRASVQSKKSCIAPWTTHGLRSESCGCASGSRRRPHLWSILTSRTFGGYGHQRNEHETGSDAVHSPRSFVCIASIQVFELAATARPNGTRRCSSKSRGDSRVTERAVAEVVECGLGADRFCFRARRHSADRQRQSSIGTLAPQTGCGIWRFQLTSHSRAFPTARCRGRPAIGALGAFVDWGNGC
jgi:hypothetical protein